MKRFMMLAALFGAMTLGACVDNEESQSVTDIRDAKTEELKSLAALNNAQAEAAKIAANAEAALKAAEAAYQQALADQVKAQTALLEVEAQLAAVKVELKGAELEAKLAELEALKAEYNQRITEAQAAIAKAEAQLEIDLAKAEYDLLVAQKDVLDATQDLEDAQKINYMSLYNTYSIAVSNLNSAKSMLVRAQKNYTATEESIIADEEAALEAIESYKESIAELEETIALWQTRVDAFAEYVTLTDEELEAKIEEKIAEIYPAQTKRELAYANYHEYVDSLTLPEHPRNILIEYTNYMVNMYRTMANQNHPSWEFWVCDRIGMDYLRWNSETNELGFYLPNIDPYYQDFYPVFQKDGGISWSQPYTTEYVEVEVATLDCCEGAEDAENLVLTANAQKLSPNEAWKLNTENFDTYMKLWGQTLEEHYSKKSMDRYQKQAEEMEKKANSTEKGSEGEYVLYKNAVEAWVKAKEDVDVAQEKRDAAWEAYLDVADTVKDPSNPTADETKALDDAYKAFETALTALQTAWGKLDEAEATLNDTRMIKEWVAEDIENVKSWAAYYAEEYEARKAEYEEACAVYEMIKEGAALAADEKTYEEYNNFYPELYTSEKFVAWKVAQHEVDHIYAQINALEEAYAADDRYEDVVNNWTNQIEQLEANIEYYNEQIAALEEQIADPNHEETLARLQEAIEMAELRVAAAQKLADEAKAALDAALAE